MIADTEPVLSLDARFEHALLGSVLSGFGDISRLAAIVRPSDFESLRHSLIWTAILAAHDAGAQPETLAVARRLVEAGDIAKAGGHLYLHTLTEPDSCPLPYSAPYYAHQVQRGAAGRRLAELAGRMEQMIERREPDEVIAAVRRELEAASRASGDGDVFSLPDALVEFIDDLDAEHATGPDWPWPDLSRYVSALEPGMLIVVGARPGVGKSLMGIGVADHVARIRRHPVLVSSLEMPRREVLARLVAARAKVNLSELLGRRVPPMDYARAVTAQTEYEGVPLDLDDTPKQTVAHMSARAARTGAQVIVVDYMQLVEPIDRRLPRVEQIGQISRDLKLMARDRNACVVAMAQVNRASVGKTRPTMADLRESGSIENDADVVIMLDDDKDVPELDVYVDKNRNGPKGQLRLQVFGHYARLASTAWTPHDAAGVA